MTDPVSQIAAPRHSHRPRFAAGAAMRVRRLIEHAAAVDESLAAHSAGVAAMAAAVARELGVKGRELEALELAAAAHDVGKLAIPSRLLMKPTPLTWQEWNVIRTHPTVGADLVARCGAPSNVVEMVRSHHERWDGRGYPGRRSTTRIVFGARIIAVADAYCAMIEPRPYRVAWPADLALEELLRNAGTQFDPDCVVAASRVVA